MENPNEAPACAGQQGVEAAEQPRRQRRNVAPPNVAPAPPVDLGFSTDPPCDRPPTPWRSSRAKKVLFHDIVTRIADNCSGPMQIFCSRPIHQRCERTDFGTNCRNLKRSVACSVASAAATHAAVVHDLAILDARRDNRPWRGSDAQIQLRQDVVSGRADGKTPRQVFCANDRAMCRQNGMTLSKFSSHLAHERNRNNRQLQARAFEARMRFINHRPDEQ